MSVPRFIDVRYERATNDWYVESEDSVAALLSAERFSGLSWDPACGLGTIPKTMQAAGHRVCGTDLVYRGYVGRHEYVPRDFLTGAPIPEDIANIVSNPPFNLAQQFVDRALAIALHKVAFLLPLTFLEGMKRARWLEATPLARVYVCSWRVSMPPGELLTAGAVKAEGGKKAFAWLVWEHGWSGPPQVRWLHRPAVEEPTKPRFSAGSEAQPKRVGEPQSSPSPPSQETV